ncbi:TPA: tripartite tricarboxylate transporter permease, partial [Vibrio vulnificus]|nr:tripartite tricarboxylate transporter permease [Vibrio vulnificus]
ANFPLAPLLLGFILGGLMEENLRRALMISDGQLSFLWERPLTLAFTVIAILMVSSPLLGALYQKIKPNTAKSNVSQATK